MSIILFPISLRRCINKFLQIEFKKKLLNYNMNNPFEADFLNEHLSYVDINVTQRNSRKCWTIISNLTISDKEKKDFLQKLKKKLSCNGSVDENGNIKITGDHKKEISPLITSLINIPQSRIRLH